MGKVTDRDRSQAGSILTKNALPLRFTDRETATRNKMLLEDIAAALAARSAAWQPIETAPKDGRSFLVAHAGTEFMDRAFFISPTELITVGGQYKPTHWMPLPDPPEVK